MADERDSAPPPAALTPKHLADALARVTEGVIIRDRDLTVLYTNPAAKRILGIRDAAEVDPASLTEWSIYDEHGTPAPLALRDVVEAGVSWHGRMYEIRRPGQQSQWLRSASAPFPLADGSLGSLSLFTDVSDERRSQLAAEQNEQHFRLITDNANDVMWRNDLEGIVTWISPSVTRILGWRPEELVGRFMVDVVHPDDRSAALRGRAAAGLGQRAANEVRFQRADGTWCPMGVRAGPFLDAEQRTVGTFATARDMTRERLSQHQVEGSERRFRVLAQLGERLQIVEGAEGIAQAGADFVANNIGDGVIVTLLDEPTSQLAVTAVAHPDGAGERLLARLRDVPPVAVATAVSAGVVASGRSSLTTDPDIPSGVRELVKPYQDRFGLTSLVIVPLAAYGRIIGTLAVSRDATSPPLGARDRDLLDELANRMALAIHDGVLRDRAARAERQYRLITEYMSDVVVRIDKAGEIGWVSPSALERFGWEPAQLVGLAFFDLVDPDHRADLETALQAEPGTPAERTFRFRTRGGRYVWVSASVGGVREGADTPAGLILSLRDRDAEMQARAELETSERRFRLAMQQSPVGMTLVDLHGRWLEVNETFSAIVGYPAEELLQLSFQDITHPDDLDADLDLHEQLLAGLIPEYRMHKRYIRRDGSPVWIELRVSLVRSAAGEPQYFVTQTVDLDATLADQHLADQRRIRDQVTGLITRHSLIRALNLLMMDQRHPGRWVCLLACDVDGFSSLNQRYGRAAGNWILHEVARRISERIRAGDCAGRVGPDEFDILLTSIHSRDEAVAIAEQLRGIVAEPIRVPGHDEPVSVSVCIGIALATSGSDPEHFMAQADAQLRRARDAGPGHVAAGEAPDS